MTKRFASCYLRHVEWRVALEIVGRLNETRKDILSLPFQKNLQYLEEEEKKKNYSVCDREISNEHSITINLRLKKKNIRRNTRESFST